MRVVRGMFVYVEHVRLCMWRGMLGCFFVLWIFVCFGFLWIFVRVVLWIFVRVVLWIFVGVYRCITYTNTSRDSMRVRVRVRVRACVRMRACVRACAYEC